MNFQQILMVAATQGGGVAASPGIASWPALIGAEMMVNGDCSSATGWELSAGVAIALGKMTTTAFTNIIPNNGITDTTLIGATYRCAFTIDTVSLGTMEWSGGVSGTAQGSVGTFSQDLLSSDVSIFLSATSSTMQLDNFSVKSVGLMGTASDWSFTGGALFDAGVIIFIENPADSAALTGAAATAFDAAVSDSTACNVTIFSDQANPLTGGGLNISLKGGTPFTFLFNGFGAPVTQTVTSGTGSGFLMSIFGTLSGGTNRIFIELA